jgi:hypothetical protein
VGPQSDPVVITYTAVGPTPVEFHFVSVYRTAECYLDAFHVAVDQTGPGTEEFHVSGFIQEMFPTGSDVLGAQQKFNFYCELHPDGPRTESDINSFSFGLHDPDSPEWPRSYPKTSSHEKVVKLFNERRDFEFAGDDLCIRQFAVPRKAINLIKRLG